MGKLLWYSFLPGKGHISQKYSNSVLKMLCWRIILLVFSVFQHAILQERFPTCKWNIHNCDHAEIICGPDETIHLGAKYFNRNFAVLKPKQSQQCFAIRDNEHKGHFNNYEIQVEIMSLESIKGVNCGNLGIIFNYRNEMNYDFVYME